MTARQKIAILGGGVGAIAAAWQITSEPDWQQRYEVTLYQMGWRLGGKGASGRSGPHQRIEEHGLHIWLGFYHNAFRMLQAALTEINAEAAPAPAGNTPPRIDAGVFLRCEDAFLPHNHVGVYQQFAGQPQPWMVDFPANDQKPWEGNSLPSVWSYIQELVRFMGRQARDPANRAVYAGESAEPHAQLRAWLSHTVRTIETNIEPNIELDIEDLALGAGFAALALLEQRVASLTGKVDQHNPLVHQQIATIIAKLQGWIGHELGQKTGHDLASLRHLLLIDTCLAILCGLFRAGAFDGAKLNTLDDEFRVWLRESGALPVTCSLVSNPLLRGVYDFVFAFDGGDAQALDTSANFATAPALRTIFRMCLTYDGAIFWKMRAGMGDTIFTPMYKALAKRGVQFRFFHKVLALELSADGASVARIAMAEQVTCAQPYRPLLTVRGLDCWPSRPDYDQMSQADALRAAETAQGLSLESHWFDWPDARAFKLERGRDFDTVVFGISLGSVPLVGAQLCAASPAWQRMVDQVRTVSTMGYQLWLQPDLQALGWSHGSGIIDAFDEPLDTWADMSHLLPMENWEGLVNRNEPVMGSSNAPANIAYFCGALKEGPLDLADKQTPQRAAHTVQAAIDALLGPTVAKLWPAAVDDNGRFKARWVVESFQRANIDPSERYVMSVAHSSAARLKANATGFDNLLITGDWIDNGFNAGCVEAAAMAGIEAGNALLGRDLYSGVIGKELC